MIRFPCSCGHLFSLDDAQAGGLIQCPKCARLNDIPTLDELVGLSGDGTFNVRSGEQAPTPKHVAEVAHYFGPARVDESGREKDLRNTVADARRAGVDEEATRSRGPVRPLPPRYDPETGRLIRAIPMAASADPPSHEIPVARAVLSYAVGEPARAYNPFRIILDLCSVTNLFVMFFIFAFHVAAQIISIGVLLRLYFAAVPVALIAFLLLAHYGNVIDEIGPEARDELPRPLRSVSWRDDLWGPFTRVLLALAYCYGPVAFVMNLGSWPDQRRILVAVPLVFVGSLLFPAALLTTTTSGSAVNLRPDRVVGVAIHSGWRYLLAVGSWLLAVAAYGVGHFMTSDVVIAIITHTAQSRGLQALSYTILLAGIFLMHFFCWQLGLLYRLRHETFPWAYQRHIPRSDPRRRKMQKAE